MTLDRRSFLGRVGMMAGAVVATSMVPLSVVHAVPTGSLALSGGSEGNWHVDDICGHWPPYSHPIGYGHVRAPEVSLSAYADPIDHIFLV